MRQQMPKQDPAVRRTNFDEVALGFTAEQALAEAKRCLNCKKPLCVQGCPVEIDIPQFITLLVAGKPDQALAKIKEKNSLPAICGRVCPQENQCEKQCVLGRKGEPVAIGALERYCADWGRANQAVESTGDPAGAVKEKVAVVGSGPAGLTAAADLALMGYQVTLFESLHAPGGVLRYGIPEFRLPKAIVDYEVGNLIKLGWRSKPTFWSAKRSRSTNCLRSVMKRCLSAPGRPALFSSDSRRELERGLFGQRVLTRVNLMKAYLFPEYDTPIRIRKRVAVVGAGTWRWTRHVRPTARAETVSIVYRRSRAEMPARREEIENAEEEGVVFRLLTNPVRLEGDERGNLTTMVCQKMALGEPDASGRRRPVPIPGSEEELPVDTVIVAVGQGPNPILLQATTGLALNKRGYIEVDPETMMTSIPGVFAGGNIVTGAATVIAAMGAGKKAARAIDRYLAAKKEAGK